MQHIVRNALAHVQVIRLFGSVRADRLGRAFGDLGGIPHHQAGVAMASSFRRAAHIAVFVVLCFFVVVDPLVVGSIPFPEGGRIVLLITHGRIGHIFPGRECRALDILVVIFVRQFLGVLMQIIRCGLLHIRLVPGDGVVGDHVHAARLCVRSRMPFQI